MYSVPVQSHQLLQTTNKLWCSCSRPLRCVSDVASSALIVERDVNVASVTESRSTDGHLSSLRKPEVRHHVGAKETGTNGDGAPFSPKPLDFIKHFTRMGAKRGSSQFVKRLRLRRRPPFLSCEFAATPQSYHNSRMGSCSNKVSGIKTCSWHFPTLSSLRPRTGSLTTKR